jgi:dihydroflavonol-4-reductase
MATTKPRTARKNSSKKPTKAVASKKTPALAQKTSPKILVTGGTGFLGSHVVRELISAGAKNIRVMASNSSAPLWMTEAGVETIEGSITNAMDVARALEDVVEVYHLAGRVSRDARDARAMYAVHVDGTRLLCEAAAGTHRVKTIVMASTSGTIAVTKEGDIIPDEEWPPPVNIIARWPYYASKFYQERAALEFFSGSGKRLVILNPSLLLGPSDERLSSTKVVLDFLAHKVSAIPRGGLSFVDVRDAARAFLMAMQQGAHGERYLLGGANWTFEKFFARLERLTKTRAPRLKLPPRVAATGAQVAHALFRHWNITTSLEPEAIEMADYFWYLDATKARRELGFVPRDPAETLNDTVKYVRANFLGNDAFRNED